MGKMYEQSIVVSAFSLALVSVAWNFLLQSNLAYGSFTWYFFFSFFHSLCNKIAILD